VIVLSGSGNTPAVSLSRLGLVTIILSSLVLAAFSANSEIKARAAFKKEMAGVTVIPPEGKPEASQASIDLAMVMFGIEIPAGAKHPVFDPELRDRGLTARGAYSDKATVSVGPAAFSSWALLASTLGHELEVHCNQNFLFIYLMDFLRLDGTGSAEREAYVYELRNARRFGLDIKDADMIADTMEYYYPDTTGSLSLFPGVRRWLARNLVTSRIDL
jgi:hypothetical protein